MAEEDFDFKINRIKIQGRLNFGGLDAWLDPKWGGGFWKKVFNIGHVKRVIFEWGRINPKIIGILFNKKEM